MLGFGLEGIGIGWSGEKPPKGGSLKGEMLSLNGGLLLVMELDRTRGTAEVEVEEFGADGVGIDVREVENGGVVDKGVVVDEFALGLDCEEGTNATLLLGAKGI